MSTSSPNRTSRELLELQNGLGSLQITGTHDSLPGKEAQNGLLGLSKVDAAGTTPSIANEELERFRREWQKEVQAKKGKDKEVDIDVGPARWKVESRGDERIEVSAGQSTSTTAAPARAQRRDPSRSPSSPTKSLKHTTSPRSPVTTLQDEVMPSTSSASSRLPTHALSPATTRKAHTTPKASRESRREDAVMIYARAVENEQSGQLNEALMLYRQAFKLDDNVDRLYTLHRSRQITTPTLHSSTDLVSSTPPVDEPYSFQRHIQLQPDYQSNTPTTTTNTTTRLDSPLTTIFKNASISPEQAIFLPAEETLPIPIASVPGEIFGHIMTHLDVASLERLGSTCWRARYLTSHSDKWRTLVHGIYVPPAIIPRDDKRFGLAGVAEMGKKYGGEWRTLLIEEDRVRMDGCYIAVCHYVRPGAGDEWVAITHMITYHRFLRFYPDGTVISFLTTDHPSEVVPRLRPSLRSKGLHIGKYHLVRPDNTSESHSSPNTQTQNHEHQVPIKQIYQHQHQQQYQNHHPYQHQLYQHNQHQHQHYKKTRIVITELLEPGSTDPKYEFEMELSLRETGRGRWNKLDILDYRSINLATGESLGLALKHQKPFYFSKVKSYHPSF